VSALAAVLSLLLASVAPPLVDVSQAIPDAVQDLRYATDGNFTGRALYPPGARCLLLRPVVDRLARAAARLGALGYRLRLYDCYRPVSVQRELWRHFPRKGFVADPREVELPTAYDAFEPRAAASATAGVSPAARRHRDLLRRAMEAEGFHASRHEWWHFDAPEAHGAPLLDVPLAP
jgi:D-alanyl-D-alanine dipeptidase